MQLFSFKSSGKSSGDVHTKPISLFTIMAFSFLLASCGGGGDNQLPTPQLQPQPEPQPQPQPQVPEESIRIEGDKTAKPNQSVGMAVIRSNTDYNRYQWRQVSGAPLNILGSKQPAVSVTPTKAGNYVFEVTVSVDGKKTLTQQHEITVADVTPVTAQLRNDRAATANGLISLRLYSKSVTQAADWELVQTSGTQASILKNTSQTVAQITLPSVSKDTVLTFDAKDTNGNVLDTAYVLVQPKTSASGGYFCDTPTQADSCLPLTAVGHHYAYNTSSIYAKNLVPCVMSNIINQEGICTLNTLTFIGQKSNDPSLSDIMERVVVSHDWMGRNFEAFLKQYDSNNDFKRLLRSATSIVISDNVKPSFYWAANSTVYLDADYLWLTPQERDSVTERADYRSGFGNGLSFFYFSDYAQGEESIYRRFFVDRRTRGSRTLADISPALASLLYHELAHVNDFIPASVVSKLTILDGSKIPFNLVTDQRVSDRLEAKYPLADANLKGLAKVLYFGQVISDVQKSYTPTQVSDWFFADKANAGYNYSNSREDFAMVFEEAMMLSRLKADRYQMVMDAKTERVAQGQKNRITESNLYDRASFVVGEVLPEALTDVTNSLSSKTPTALCAGADYSSYLNTSCTKQMARSAVPTESNAPKLLKRPQRPHFHVHKHVY